MPCGPEANRLQSDSVSGLVVVDGSRMGSGDPTAAEQAMADELAGDGYRDFIRKFFESMFFPSSNPALAKAIIERGLRFPTGLGRTLMTDLAGWDAREMESALDSVDVPRSPFRARRWTPHAGAFRLNRA